MSTFDGYHRFKSETGEEYGSFEVLYTDGRTSPGFPEVREKGWYWWPCHPGCLPDGGPTGPFPTAEGAYLDAIGD